MGRNQCLFLTDLERRNMYIDKIKISNFRNIENLEVQLNKNINILVGDNAQGKTNFLEAIYLSGIGRSFRTHYDKELINFNHKESYIHTFVNSGVTDKISLGIFNYKNKIIHINGLPVKKLGELLGIMYIVSFTPENLQLVKAGPNERRRFMDMELCQLEKMYYYDLKQYNHILKQRNALLKKIKFTRDAKDTLYIWDEKLIYHGLKIMKSRHRFIGKINSIACDIHFFISNEKENLELVYKNNISEENFSDKLKANLDKDIMYGSTSVGVHKDDLGFFINGKEAKSYGSQGQQRTASLCTKLAEIKLIEEEKREKPILLLDDVLSELDKNRQKFLLKNIRDLQTIITCTGVEDVLKNLEDDISVFYVENGNINENYENFKKIHAPNSK